MNHLFITVEDSAPILRWWCLSSQASLPAFDEVVIITISEPLKFVKRLSCVVSATAVRFFSQSHILSIFSIFFKRWKISYFGILSEYRQAFSKLTLMALTLISLPECR